MITMLLLNDWAALKPFLFLLASVPSLSVWLSGFLVGALTAWAGWNAGKRRPTVPAAAQPA